jgi:hypothetical protein
MVQNIIKLHRLLRGLRLYQNNLQMHCIRFLDHVSRYDVFRLPLLDIVGGSLCQSTYNILFFFNSTFTFHIAHVCMNGGNQCAFNIIMLMRVI